MKRLIAAGALSTSITTLWAPGVPAGAEPPDEPGESHCVIEVDPTGKAHDLGCYSTFAAAQSSLTATGGGPESGSGDAATSTVTVGWHFEHANGVGSSVTVTAAACSTTWIPSSWWATHMSSTRVGPSCSGAKHYTLAACSGSAQLVNAAYPTITNLNGTLNDNSPCVKYA